jgi:hypothetical protein
MFSFFIHAKTELLRTEILNIQIMEVKEFFMVKVKIQQIKFPFHEYGYIELKPNFTDTLKKLIAMSFEYLLEPSRNAKQDNRDINPRPENEMFCLNCGGTNITMTES